VQRRFTDSRSARSRSSRSSDENRSSFTEWRRRTRSP
jgi:hypothetical protein